MKLRFLFIIIPCFLNVFNFVIASDEESFTERIKNHWKGTWRKKILPISQLRHIIAQHDCNPLPDPLPEGITKTVTSGLTKLKIRTKTEIINPKKPQFNRHVNRASLLALLSVAKNVFLDKNHVIIIKNKKEPPKHGCILGENGWYYDPPNINPFKPASICIEVYFNAPVGYNTERKENLYALRFVIAKKSTIFCVSIYPLYGSTKLGSKDLDLPEGYRALPVIRPFGPTSHDAGAGAAPPTD